MRRLCFLFLLSGLFCIPANVRAFCGFYVSGADASLYNNATMVVLMREGTRTVMSMQNNYQGPPEDFAMVVPVPVVLQEKNVKTLPREIFQRVDKLAAPRLVEYWEQDPCRPRIMYKANTMARGGRGMPTAVMESSAADHGVTIEAQFKVAEYDILILSAKESSGLDKWLRKQKYNIPKGAEKVLRPYVQSGTKFFVAKVDVEKVKFKDGAAVLSPLRFHFDSEEFSLPVRLGLLNSSGEQDLIVHILARNQRYEVANYPNVTIPTNLRVKNAVRHDYASFYDALFKKVLEKNPGAVVTEYSWNAMSCDPCPEQPLNHSELATLGADVINEPKPKPYNDVPGVIPPKRRPPPQIWRPIARAGFVLTRLHYRYSKGSLGKDLVFKVAPPIVGGRGMPDRNGEFQERRAEAQPSGINNFQGRYIILHVWDKPMECEFPQRGQWGGPPGEGVGVPWPGPRPIAAPNPILRGGAGGLKQMNLPVLLKAAVPELDLAPMEESAAAASGQSESPTPSNADINKEETKSEADESCSIGFAKGGLVWGLIPLLLALLLIRRRHHG